MLVLLVGFGGRGWAFPADFVVTAVWIDRFILRALLSFQVINPLLVSFSFFFLFLFFLFLGGVGVCGGVSAFGSITSASFFSFFFFFFFLFFFKHFIYSSILLSFFL